MWRGFGDDAGDGEVDGQDCFLTTSVPPGIGRGRENMERECMMFVRSEG